MATVSTSGYTNVEGMKTTSQEEFSEEDGYFTCAVSVQHKTASESVDPPPGLSVTKLTCSALTAGGHFVLLAGSPGSALPPSGLKHDFETSSAYSASDSEHARKVVWPANQTKVEKQTVDTSRTFQNAFKQSTGQLDQPHKWLQMSEHEDMEKKTEKASFEMRQGAYRVSRSNSRSKNIMDRARSFERAAAESRGNSRPASRTGSIASRQRSPSGNRGQVDEMWMNQVERPGSRTDVDSRRFGEIGKVQTADWEGRIKGSTENLPTRTPPPKRREISMKRNPDSERGLDTKTPEPPPPPTRMTYPPNTIKEPECEFPPPPESDTKSKLSEESVGQLSEENKENIVKQWVESTTQSAEDIAKELEKFAYDIAETVVSNMEKNSEKKDSYGTHSHQSVVAASSHEQTQKTQASSGLYFAAPASTSRRELHGPVYVQEENRRVGMTFQQEERRREELRKQEEAKQEEKRRCELELEAQHLQEEQQRKLVEMKRAQEEEMRRQEETRRVEMERQQKLVLQRQEEERKRQAEIEKQAEKIRQEEIKRAEEQRLKQLEMKKIEEEKKRQEILRFEKLRQEEELKRQEEIRLEQEMRRFEKLKQEEELKRQEEMRLEQEMRRFEKIKQEEELKRQEEMILEQEMRRQFEVQQQIEIQCKREQQLLLEQQQMLQQQKEKELQQSQARQESMSVRDHIPKLSKTKSFEASQDRQNEIKHEDHLGSVKTGQVNEKRNFWIRSTSADRLNQVSLSPAPRRRRIDWNANRQKENEDPESRPGSSLGQAQTGSVKNLSSGFIAKSKSSAAVMQDELERGRPKQKTVANGWTKEQYDHKVKQDFLKSQEVKTNKVTDTVQTWGKRDSSATGRTTPAPSRNIGEGFSENRVGKSSEVDKNANSWRTKTPEPTLKLVNVSVEKAIGSNQNIHISENAHKQMANFLSSSTIQQKEEVMNTVMTNTMSSESSVTSHSMSTTSRCSADINSQPPPTPERNQSYGGKCENTIKPKTEPIRNEPKKTVSDATIDTVVQTSTEASVTDMTANIEQSVKTVSSNNESVKTITPLPVSIQDQIQQTVQHSNLLQNSTSTQSINSVLSTCSSSALPKPVKEGWFDEMEHLSTTSNSSYAIPEGVLSPTGTGKTPLPVVANWFDALEAKITKPNPEIMSKPVRNEQAENKPNVVILNEKACPDKTTSLLNEILDELVIDESALELHESSEETGTIKRKQTEHAKSFISDDVDNRSVKSDATVIENKDNEKEESVIVVPQSPREIRKKFQVASSFERSFTKSADLELSKEFKEGIKGKVKESKDNFLRQAIVDAKAKETNSKQGEMEEIKFHRAVSQTKIDQEDSKADNIKQEKLRELEAVKRSRSKSRAKDDESVQNSYLQEKRERELELLQLANRSTNMSWESENKELQLREERNKELAELVNRTVDVESESEVIRNEKILKDERNHELALLANRKIESIDITSENKTSVLKEERRRELDELSNRKVDIDHEHHKSENLIKEERAKELLVISNRTTDAEFDMEKSEQIWNERAEELKQIASMRSKSPWQQECRESPTMEKNIKLDAPELKGKVRNTAAAWKERERETKIEKDSMDSKDIPTRRIGSLFKKDSDYWNLNEVTDEFPEPPSEAEIAQVSHNPPPPLRQSSKGKIEEYTRDPNWNAPWRKS